MITLSYGQYKKTEKTEMDNKTLISSKSGTLKSTSSEIYVRNRVYSSDSCKIKLTKDEEDGVIWWYTIQNDAVHQSYEYGRVSFKEKRLPKLKCCSWCFSW